jgi:cyanophycin synthetase
LEEEFPLEKIILSEQGNIVLEIQKQGFEIHSVTNKHQVIVVQRTGNMANDVTDDVHPKLPTWLCLLPKWWVWISRVSIW